MQMINQLFFFFINSISKESVIDVEGDVSLAPTPIESCSQKNVEIQVKKVDMEMIICV